MTMIKRLCNRAAAMVAIALVAAVVLLPAASAHTAMLRASPDRNATAGGAVQFVDLEFLDPVTNTAVTVTYNGVPVAGQVTEANGKLITFTLDQPLTQPGRYQVNYEMISFDSDFTTGGYFFSFDPLADQPTRIELSAAGGISTATIIASVVGLLLLGGLLALFVRRIDNYRSEQFDFAEDASDDWAEGPYG
jgi:methionine-rich copper-binding protein CopC